MEYLYTYLWKSAIIVTLFYWFYKLFLDKETYFKSIRYFLLLGIVFAFTLPFILVPIYTEPAQLTQVITDTILTNNTASVISSPSINWSILLFYIYSTITIFLLFRFIFQLASIILIIVKNKSIKTGNYYYIEIDNKISPFSFFNFIIYNPILFNERELKQILTHEKAHAFQRHSFDTLLSNLLIVIQWYNPFAWVYKKEIEKNLEFIADEYAQKKSNTNQSYQHLLLKTSIPNYQMALTNNFYNSLLKKRIIMLHKKRSNSKSQWKIALIIPILLAFIFTFNTKTIAQQKKSNKKIMKMNVEVFAMKITKESTKDELNEIIKSFAEKELNVNFSGVKRNENDQITAIKIDAKAKSGKASAAYAADVNEGINPIQISFDNKNNDLSIGSSNRHNMHGYSFSKKGHRKIIKHKGKGNSYVVFSGNDNEDHSSTKVWVNKDGDTTKIKEMIVEIDEDNHSDGVHEIIIHEDDNGKEVKKEVIKIRTKKGDSKGNYFFISDDEDDNDENSTTTYIVNGKKMSKEEFKKFDKDKIKTIEIKKEIKKKN